MEVDLEVEANVDEAQAEIESLDADPVDVQVDADTAEAASEIEGVADNAPGPVEVPVSAPGAEDATTQVDGLAEALGGLQGVAASAAAAGGLGAAFGATLSAFGDAEAATAILNAQLERTGGVANVTADDVLNLSSKVQSYSGISDESVTAAQSLLLSFKSVRNEAGEGNDVFTRAIELGADLTFLFETDLAGATRQLGLALASPADGLTRLTRTGVEFTDAEKELITTLQESGDILGAQTLLLDIVEGQVGDTAEAYGQTLPGQVDRATNALGDLLEVVGAAGSEAVGPLLDAITALAEGFFNLPEPVQRLLGLLAAAALAFGTTAAAAAVLSSTLVANLVASLTAAATSIASTVAAFAVANPAFAAVAAAAALTGAVLYAFGGDSDDAAEASDTLTAAIRNQRDAFAGLEQQVNELNGDFVTVGADEFNRALEAAGFTTDDLRDALAGSDADLQAFGSALAETGEIAESERNVFSALANEFLGIGEEAEDGNAQFQSASGRIQATLQDLREEFRLAQDQAAVLDAVYGDAAVASDELAGAQTRSTEEIQRFIDTAVGGLPQASAALSGLEEGFDPQQIIDNLAFTSLAISNFVENIATLAGAGFTDAAVYFAEQGAELAAAPTQSFVNTLAFGPAAVEALEEQLGNVESSEARGEEVFSALGLQWGDDVTTGFEDSADLEGPAERSVDAAAGAITSGAANVGAAADAAGNEAAENLSAGFGLVPALLTTVMAVATATVAAGGVTLTSTAATVGRSSGTALGAGFAATAPQGVRLGMSIAGVALSGQGVSLAVTAGQVGNSIGGALGAGIVSGIDSYIGRIRSAARDAVNEAEAAARDAADTGSPSKLFAAVGADMGEGLAIGFAESARALVAEAEAVTFGAAAGVGGGGSVGSVSVSVVVNGDASPEAARLVQQGARDGVAEALAEARQAFDVAVA